MEFLSLYWMYIRMFFRSRAEYRVGFFLGIFANFYSYFISFVTFWVIVTSFGSINNWSFEELCILYGLNMLGYSTAGMFFWSVLGLEDQITNGDLDTYLTRPMGLIRQIVCKKFTETFIGQIVVTIIFIGIAFLRLDIKMTFGIIVFSLLSVCGATLVHSAAMIFFGSLSFWIKRSLPIADLLYFDLKNFIQYPLSIYPILIRILLTFVLPWALTNYYPALVILQKYNSTSELIIGILSPLLGVLYFFLSLKVFNWGVKHYESSGS